MPRDCDLYIGSRSHRVIGLVRNAKRRLFWLHNPARYLRKARNAWRLAWWRPTLVVTGAYHAKTIPSWLVHGGCETIPYGVLDRFRGATPREPPPPYAIFTSNPLRGLDWLLDVWVTRIAPAIPEAELHIYAGPSVYGALGVKRAGEMEAVLARADGLGRYGVRRFAPIGREVAGVGACRRPGHAVPRRSWRDFLPLACRGAGDGRARGRDSARCRR